MIIKELNLISFGKFQNKTIKLDQGLNIIYGENESGKTTLHSFIEGMFYGFLRPYVSRRFYTEAMEKYRPWGQDNYKGIMKLSQNGKAYRIERDFHMKEVRIYDELTGNDISKEVNPGLKLQDPLPGLYFFQFNSMVYNNTISIKQLKNRIDEKLAKEVKDKIANISTSLDQDISVKKALADLDNQLAKIGSEIAPTRPYGRAIKSLEKLEGEKAHLFTKREEFKKELALSLELREKLEKEKEKIHSLEQKLKYLEIEEMEASYQEAQVLKAKLEDSKEAISNLSPYSLLSYEDYESCLKSQKDQEYLEREIVDLESATREIDKKLGTLEGEEKDHIVDGLHVDEVFEDLALMEEGEEEKNQLLISGNENKLTIYKSQLENKIGREARVRLFASIFLISSLASLGLLFINKFFFLLTIGLGISSLLFRKLRGKARTRLEGLNETILDLEAGERERKERIEEINRTQGKILEKYKKSSKLELKRLKEDIYFKYRNSQIREEELSQLKKRKKTKDLGLGLKKEELERARLEISRLLERNSSKDLNEFKIGLDKKKNYQELLAKRDNYKEILARILGETSLEEMKEELKAIEMEGFSQIKGREGLDKTSLNRELKEGEARLQNYLDLYARVEERINNLNSYVEEFVFLEEEIEKTMEEIGGYRNKITAINIAKETIEDISKQLHQEFAPSINKDVGKIIEVISENKYNQVRIDEDLNITVENPRTQEIIDIDSLSGGTIDQLYFALRFSIINSIKEEATPIILDDCFIQYDDNRLKNILEYLKRVSKDKQIILFTCHKREKRILRDLGFKYSLVKLEDEGSKTL